MFRFSFADPFTVQDIRIMELTKLELNVFLSSVLFPS